MRPARPVLPCRPCLAIAVALAVLALLAAEAPEHCGMFRTGTPDEMPFFDPRSSNDKLSFSRIGDRVIVDGDLDFGTVKDVLERSWKLAVQTAKAAEKVGLDELKLGPRQKEALHRLAKMSPEKLPADRAEAEKRIRFANEVLGPLQAMRKPTASKGDREQAYLVFAGSAREFLWKDGVIPYVIELEKPGRDQVTKAMKVWMDKTSRRICFKPKAAGRDNDYVCFVTGDGCRSQWVGKMGGKQTVTLDNRCALPQVLHEIGHVLGLFHEHNRPDRNSKIDVDEKNIDDRALAQFSQNPLLAGEDRGESMGKFDWKSIMLYPPNAFGKNGRQALFRKDNRKDLNWGLYIGPGSGNGVTKEPSSGDVDAIVRQYGKKE